MGRTLRTVGLAGLLALSGASVALAQSSTASSYSKGYGAMATPVNVSTRDANGNRVITDGVIQTGNDNSILGKLSVSGALDQYSGAGAASSTGSATAIGNNLQVSVSGNYNTVIVNANQTNNGTVTATTTILNGKINLDGQ
jgi:holdfast attachment protein HfaA